MVSKEELNKISDSLISLNAILGEFTIYLDNGNYDALELAVQKEIGFRTGLLTVRGPKGVVRIYPKREEEC